MLTAGIHSMPKLTPTLVDWLYPLHYSDGSQVYVSPSSRWKAGTKVGKDVRRADLVFAQFLPVGMGNSLLCYNVAFVLYTRWREDICFQKYICALGYPHHHHPLRHHWIPHTLMPQTIPCHTRAPDVIMSPLLLCLMKSYYFRKVCPHFVGSAD